MSALDVVSCETVAVEEWVYLDPRSPARRKVEAKARELSNLPFESSVSPGKNTCHGRMSLMDGKEGASPVQAPDTRLGSISMIHDMMMEVMRQRKV